VTPAADLGQSSVAVAPASVQVGGTSTITLTARDANGTQLTTGGLTVAFGLGTGTGQGTFGTVTDNGNGTYTATFTGTTAGTNTITATINGQAVTSTAPTITVTVPADLGQSSVTVAPTSIPNGGTATVTLTARDAGGTQLTTGGLTVTFGLGTGTAQGTFGTVADNGDGTYTATFTGTNAGTNTITATINGQAVTSTAPTLTIT
jgi:adhesin/invasin